jgi:hypothetical protein
MQLTKLNHILNWVHSFDTLTGIWTEQLVDEAWTRMGHSASLLDPRRILIYGGELAQPEDLRNSKARLSRDLLVLDTAAMCASTVMVHGEAPPSRSFHSASLVPASVHSAATATAEVPGAKPAPVAEKGGEGGGGREALEANALYVFGGKLGGVSVNDLMVFDTATRTWSYPAMSGRLPDPRFGHSSAFLRHDASGSTGSLILAGGRNHFGKQFSDVWVLSLGEGAWSHLPSVGSGLLGMLVGGILQPQAQGVSGLLLFGMVALEEGGGAGGVKHCLALCALERLVRTRGTISPRTAENGRALGGADHEASISDVVNRGVVSTPVRGTTNWQYSPRTGSTPASARTGSTSLVTSTPLATARSSNSTLSSLSEQGPIDTWGVASANSLGTGSYLGSPWSRKKAECEREREITREVAVCVCVCVCVSRARARA